MTLTTWFQTVYATILLFFASKHEKLPAVLAPLDVNTPHRSPGVGTTTKLRNPPIRKRKPLSKTLSFSITKRMDGVASDNALRTTITGTRPPTFVQHNPSTLLLSQAQPIDSSAYRSQTRSRYSDPSYYDYSTCRHGFSVGVAAAPTQSTSQRLLLDNHNGRRTPNSSSLYTPRATATTLTTRKGRGMIDIRMSHPDVHILNHALHHPKLPTSTATTRVWLSQLDSVKQKPNPSSMYFAVNLKKGRHFKSEGPSVIPSGYPEARLRTLQFQSPYSLDGDRECVRERITPQCEYDIEDFDDRTAGTGAPQARVRRDALWTRATSVGW